MKAFELIKPVVHLNGTAKQDLLESRLEVTRCISTLLDRIKLDAPHPRDFYLGNEQTFEQAIEIYGSRLEMLEKLKDSIYSEMELIEG